MSKQKFYAVRKGKTTGIFDNWNECKNSVEGVAGAQYKGFSSKQDAEKYMSYDASESEDTSMGIENIAPGNVVAYIDGSFSENINRYSFGCVLITSTQIIEKLGYGDEPEALATRNIAGEMQGAIFATTWAAKNGYSHIEIRYDYEGIEKWVKKEWKANNPFSKIYVDRMQKLMQEIDVAFKKVIAHSGDKYNELADSLAKKGLTDGPRKPKVKTGAFWFTIDNISYDDISDIIDIIKNDEFPEMQRNETTIQNGKKIDLITPQKEKVAISIYKNKLVVQGKPKKLFSLLITYICELVDIDKIPEIFNDTFNIDIDKQHIDSQYQHYLPNAYDKIDGKFQKVLYQAICNLNLTGKMYDASFLVQPAFRVLEAHLKQLLLQYKIVSDYNDLKENGFNMFDKNGSKFTLQSNRLGTTTTNIARHIANTYTFFNNNRHALSHWDDPTAPMDTTSIIDTNQAHDRIKSVLNIIDTYYEII